MNYKQKCLHNRRYEKPKYLIGKGMMAGHIRGDRNRIADSPAFNISPLTTSREGT